MFNYRPIKQLDKLVLIKVADHTFLFLRNNQLHLSRVKAIENGRVDSVRDFLITRYHCLPRISRLDHLRKI